MRVWIIREGKYYNDRTWNVEACRTKKIAVDRTRELGFTWNADDGYFSNDKTKLYRKIEPFKVVG